MRLLSLSIKNVGLFRGRHEFDFTPARGAKGARRNVVVIKGANGVGKSTLFQAMSLALHGSLALGDRVSRQVYNEFLFKRLHRSDQGSVSSTSREAYIALSFQYVQSGVLRRVEVERQWQLDGAVVKESLKLQCNGDPPEINEQDYQDWLNDLIPPGLSALCFFDAERLDALSSVEPDNVMLAVVLQRLLGLDLVERLLADLKNYTINSGGGQKALDRLRAEIKKHQSTFDMLNHRLEQAKDKADALDEEKKKLESQLQQQQQRLAAEGGAYAARRFDMEERLVLLDREVQALENELREMCADLLPFALAPRLCLSLGDRLKQESHTRTFKAADALWEERIAEVKKKLRGDEIWEGLRVPANARKEIAARIARALKKSGARRASTNQFVHDLSEPESEKLQGWIAQATTTIPQQVKAIGVKLGELKEEKRRIEADLRRAPDDSVIAPIYAEVAELQSRIEEVERQRAGMREEMGRLQFQRDDVERKLQRIESEFGKLRMGENQMALAERSRAALVSYKDALIRQRLAALEKALVASFNRICRKEHLLESVSIAPESFIVTLRGASEQAMNLSEFSAGERQLYALALLWALRQVSSKQLPLAIDTPLARLDEVHRQRIIRDYISAVSDQVLLFATDTELDDTLIEEAESHIARVYRLDYQPGNGCTQVRCDSKMPQGIVIYRDGTSDIIGSANDFGQIWTADFEHAATNGAVKRAILPATAKRLVLIDSNTGDYNWEHISELERVTKDKSISKRLRSGHQIYDIWRDEWTKLLQKARYDSIATVSIEGSEEYVLNASKLIHLNGKPVQIEETAFDV